MSEPMHTTMLEAVRDARAVLTAAAALRRAAAALSSTAGRIRLSAEGWRKPLLPLVPATLAEIRKRGQALRAAPEALTREARTAIAMTADDIRSDRLQNPSTDNIPLALRRPLEVETQLAAHGLTLFGGLLLAIDLVEQTWPEVFGPANDPAERDRATAQATASAESAARQVAQIPDLLLAGLALEHGLDPALPDLPMRLIEHVASGNPRPAPRRPRGEGSFLR